MVTQDEIDAIVEHWGEQSNIGRIFSLATPEDLPIEVMQTDLTQSMVELKPVDSMKYGLVSLMFYYHEANAMVDSGMLAVKQQP